MSAPYRHPHYAQAGASSSRQHNQRSPHQKWARDQHMRPQNAYSEYSAGYGAYDAYHQDAYAGDYRAYPQSAYYDTYPNDYHRADYDRAGQGHAYGGAWNDGYGASYAQPRYEGAWAAHGAQGYPAYAAHYADGYAAAHPSDRAWSGDPSTSVQGAPAAPKKMREAAAAAAYGSEAASAHYAPYNNHGAAHFQQQRDYHPGPASRYQPYSRTPSAPGTPTHPSTYRPPTMPPRQPAAIRAAPRAEYIAQAEKESRRLSEDEARDRKLLVVLDLNGTLVFRGKGKNSRAIDSIRAVPRPYLLCFLQYCLGLSPTSASSPAAADGADEGAKQQVKVVDAETKPHGAHFWQTQSQPDGESGQRVVEPRSAGKAEVVVWSSAQPFNVDSMVRASFDASVRAQFLRVWARDTLVPARFFQHKAESVKDLEIVWAELNAFAHNRPSPGRLLAELRDQQDQLRPDDAPVSAVPTAPTGPKKYKGKHEKQRAKTKQEQEKPVSAALEAATAAQKLGPWGAENTVLVDDSVAKARLQPWNQLLIPEFNKAEAGRMKKFIRQQLRTTEEADGEEAELEYDSDLSIANDVPPAPSATTTTIAAVTAEAEAQAEADAKMDVDGAGITAQETAPKSEAHGQAQEKDHGGDEKSSLKKPIPESRLDDVLLQTIGVLETLRFQSNVSAFIHAGGITGYGQEKTALNEQQRQARVEAGNTPEYWAEQGRQTCHKLGIEVMAWIPGAAASATAALL